MERWAAIMRPMFRAVILMLWSVLVGFSARAADLEFAQQRLTAIPGAGVKEVPFSFAFTNRSMRTITISEVKPTCGCTVATLAVKTYQPGESGSISVVFVVGTTMFGMQRKQIHVYTDNPAEQDIILSVEVTLPEGPALDRRILYWNQGDALTTQVVTLTIPPHVSWSVTGAVDRQQLFTAELQPTGDPKTVKIAVTPRQTERSCVSDVLISFDGGQVMHVFTQVRKASSRQQP